MIQSVSAAYLCNFAEFEQNERVFDDIQVIEKHSFDALPRGSSRGENNVTVSFMNNETHLFLMVDAGLDSPCILRLR